MPQELFANAESPTKARTTTLSAAMLAGATTMNVVAGTGFPVAVAGVSQTRVLVDLEAFLVTNVAGLVWTVTPAIEGTVAAAHASGAVVSATITKNALENAGEFYGSSALTMGELPSGTGNNAVDEQSVTAFTKMRMKFLSGVAANFDDATDEYIVPSSGTYLIVANVRLADAFVTDGRGFGLGVHTAPLDGPFFKWNHAAATTEVKRLTFDYTRLINVVAGDRLQLYCFANVATTITNRSASFLKVASI